MSKKRKSKLGLLIGVAILLYFTYTVIDQQKIIYSKRVEMNNIQSKIKEEAKINEELKKQKESVKSDEYAEKVAREKLGMIKHGERVFVDVNR